MNFDKEDFDKDRAREIIEIKHPQYKSYKSRPLTKEEIVKVGREYSEKGSIVLGRELEVAPSCITGTVQRLRKLGIAIPNRPRRNGPEAAIKWREAVEELKHGI